MAAGTRLLVTFSNNGAGPVLPRREARGGDLGGRAAGGGVCGRGIVNDRGEVGDGVTDDDARVVTSL
jgi:hypothetical protein